uniref:Uncharacterized protein n=1 Tax=Leersia perrieri TaxID=77586 RepID=A0A0D9VCW5_9ORYZ
MQARVSSRSLRCAQFYLSFMDEVAVVDAPRLERLFLWRNFHHTREGTMVSPSTTVPSVTMLALHLHFGVWNEVKMLPSFLRCFPNVETLCVESEESPGQTCSIDTKFWQETGTIECIQSHLKMIILREFQGDQTEFSFLKFIAENARVLENMVIVMKIGRYSAPDEMAAKVMELESIKFASEGCRPGYLMSRLRKGGSIWNLKSGADLSCGDPFMCL